MPRTIRFHLDESCHRAIAEGLRLDGLSVGRPWRGKMSRISFPSFTVEVPDGWEDITDSVEGERLPFTIAHIDGFGALQFSVALYTGGEEPNPSPEQLLQMVEEFGRATGMGKPEEVVLMSGSLRLAGGSFSWDDDYVRVWQLSDGLNFAFVTYVCELGQEMAELEVCEQIVLSLSFNAPAPVGRRPLT